VQGGERDRRSESEAHLKVVRRAAEPHDADGDTAVYPPDERFKKLENHAAVVALYFMECNFGRVHQTLRATPALEAGVSLHI
jgi:hypothetical protein